MTDWKRDTQMTFLSRIPVMILALLSVILITRLLGPEGNGVYTFTYTVINLLITIFGFQLDASITYFLANRNYDQGKILSAAASHLLMGTSFLIIFMILVVFIIPGFYKYFIPHGQPIFFFFFYIVIAFVCRHLNNVFTAIMRGLYLFRSFNLYLIIGQLIPVVTYLILLALVIINKNDIPLLLFFKITLVIEVILMLAGLWMIRKNLHFNKAEKEIAKKISAYSFYNLAGSLGHFFNKRLDVWFVQHLKGTTALGHYGLATQMTNFISEALIPFNQVLSPYITGSPKEDHSAMIGRISRINLSISLLAALFIILFAQLIIPVLFGAQFSDAIPAAEILAVGIIFISQRLVFASYFRATDHNRYVIQSSWGGVVVTIILDLVLIPRYGITGAAIASVIAYAVTSLFLIFHATRMTGLQWNEILLIRREDITWLLTRKN